MRKGMGIREKDSAAWQENSKGSISLVTPSKARLNPQGRS